MPRRRRSADFESAANQFLRLPPWMQFALLLILLVVGVVWYVRNHSGPVASTPTSQSPANIPATEPTGPIDQLVLGNPSDATTDASNRNNYLLRKKYFALSYNDSNGTPNWVSWTVKASDFGTSVRKQMFDSDSTLPPGFKVVTHQDYIGGGFDRGHMCPHADRDANKESSDATFVMTNIIPQAANVNQKAWERLESYSRGLAEGGAVLYIISGPLGQGGVGLNGPAQTIANGKVVVPAFCWKVIVVVPAGAGRIGDASAITAGSRVIAVIMPNDQSKVGPSDPWTKFRTTPADIEQKTGLHFFTALPADVASALRTKLDTELVLVGPKPRTAKP